MVGGKDIIFRNLVFLRMTNLTKVSEIKWYADLLLLSRA